MLQSVTHGLTQQYRYSQTSHMKAIQISVDERWLERVDADDETKLRGRSAFIRGAVLSYLERKREAEIVAAYRRGYGGAPVTDDEFSVEGDGSPWPED